MEACTSAGNNSSFGLYGSTGAGTVGYQASIERMRGQLQLVPQMSPRLGRHLQTQNRRSRLDRDLHCTRESYGPETWRKERTEKEHNSKLCNVWTLSSRTSCEPSYFIHCLHDKLNFFGPPDVRFVSRYHFDKITRVFATTWCRLLFQKYHIRLVISPAIS